VRRKTLVARHWVGRRQHGPEHERHRPRQLAEQQPRHRGDDQDGQHDEPDGEQPDAPGLRPQVARRRREGGRVQQRREEDEEHDVGLEHDLGCARDQCDARAGEDEEDGVGDPQLARQLGEQRDGQQQADEELDVVHAPGDFPARRVRSPRAAVCPVAAARPSPHRPSVSVG
jgi:hypothetical protein